MTDPDTEPTPPAPLPTAWVLELVAEAEVIPAEQVNAANDESEQR